jgi:5,10-methenyltetrahydromethanopterin hydrogenase
LSRLNPKLLGEDPPIEEEPPIEATVIDEETDKDVIEAHADEDKIAKLKARLAELKASQIPDRE